VARSRCSPACWALSWIVPVIDKTGITNYFEIRLKFDDSRRLDQPRLILGRPLPLVRQTLRHISSHSGTTRLRLVQPRARERVADRPCRGLPKTDTTAGFSHGLAPLKLQFRKGSTTGTPSGRLATPRTIGPAACLLQTSRNNSRRRPPSAAPVLFGCQVRRQLDNPGYLIEQPECFRGREYVQRRQARCFASCSTSYCLPSRPTNFGSCPMTRRVPLR
jgi:hypothetical protein